ncbi:MAG: IS1/IS1595 family N-terminal zinc-binding domain-containing protein, partial [Candidatus Bathyarchaeota archaeon]
MVEWCPECGSNAVVRDGLRYLSNGESVQRWLCKNCGYRFSQGNTYKTEHPYNITGAHQKRILVEAQREIEKRQAGGTEQ